MVDWQYENVKGSRVYLLYDLLIQGKFGPHTADEDGFDKRMVVNNKTSKVYQTVFISGELTFIRKPSHGHKIIVMPMYILAVAASGLSDYLFNSDGSSQS